VGEKCQKNSIITLKTHVFRRIFDVLKVEIVVPENHLICDVRF
jgi:hypothetical protein